MTEETQIRASEPVQWSGWSFGLWIAGILLSNVVTIAGAATLAVGVLGDVQGELLPVMAVAAVACGLGVTCLLGSMGLTALKDGKWERF